MSEPVPAVTLLKIRRLARDAQRRGALIDPRVLAAICDGRKV